MKTKSIDPTPTLLALICIAICIAIAFTSSAAGTCNQTKKNNEPCQSTILLKDGKCRSHSTLSVFCGAAKKSGGTCRMVVKKEGEKCRYHQDKMTSFVPTF